ncbi:MAG: LysM peptidoglycan-binding domain-containing protein [Anaerolineales bacterium]|nr:LysM peptidoglycan-binding domain-containing protein [Anaerolineales bacterium]
MYVDWRRFTPYLALSIVVNIVVTLAVLWIWDRNRPRIVVEAPAITATAPAGATVAALVRTSTPTAPRPTATVHVVAPGDTLGSIAVRYGVSLEDLMAANNLTDPDVLTVGQTLAVPIGGLEPTPTEPPPDVPTTTPIPTATTDPNAPAPEVSISRVQSPGVLAQETIVLINTGGPLELTGWTLRSADGKEFTFPSLTLFQGGAVNIHTMAGENSVVDLYWGLTAPVWASGAQILLSDQSGKLQAEYTIP